MLMMLALTPPPGTPVRLLMLMMLALASPPVQDVPVDVHDACSPFFTCVKAFPSHAHDALSLSLFLCLGLSRPEWMLMMLVLAVFWVAALRLMLMMLALAARFVPKVSLTDAHDARSGYFTTCRLMPCQKFLVVLIWWSLFLPSCV